MRSTCWTLCRIEVFMDVRRTLAIENCSFLIRPGFVYTKTYLSHKCFIMYNYLIQERCWFEMGDVLQRHESTFSGNSCIFRS
ncbi:hypothetical protein HanRHA438_Chr13g0615621 [Helianthus annuus]|nr:hypothetical protein HanHA300_Chr13g0496221 [Helianthus annuus]KAJ0482742.1 hypothetical protein HanIR_Chr13g0657271 [Helianthus annuus]KAJ0498965.1 hypothetical protein HanHA89_Chr13g0528871 [Helianthus annuus]KAJ0664980.1 hypothetical protein HanLR1_Chr13g0498901 [Helianthus annuus]KAJ0672403.1 hypothetical protein HanOQP8_Chr13g0496901 [Helianthus annuus]